MKGYEPTEQQRRDDRREDARQSAYREVCPQMNRAERRTAKGRMLIAQAEAAAMRAEIEFLRIEIKNNRLTDWAGF